MALASLTGIKVFCLAILIIIFVKIVISTIRLIRKCPKCGYRNGLSVVIKNENDDEANQRSKDSTDYHMIKKFFCKNCGHLLREEKYWLSEDVGL